MSNRVEYASPVAPDASPSGAIWGQMPMEDIILHGRGYHVFQDFLGGPTLANNAAQEGLYAFIDTTSTAQPIETEVGGVFRLATAATDNKECGVQYGQTTAVMGKVASTGGKKLAFEFRFRQNSAALTDSAIFLGLCEEAAVADSTMVDDTGALHASKDWLGFRTLCAAPTALDAIYQKGGQTLGTAVAAAQTIVAGTWYKCGLVFDPSDTVEAIKYYINGTKVGASTLATVGLSTFPDGEEMTIVMALKNGEAAIKRLDVDWFKFAQVR